MFKNNVKAAMPCVYNRARDFCREVVDVHKQHSNGWQGGERSISLHTFPTSSTPQIAQSNIGALCSTRHLSYVRGGLMHGGLMRPLDIYT